MSQNIKIFIKIALFLGYALFSGWSAYFTTTSIYHKWFNNVWWGLPYVMVFICALLAGYFLAVAIKQIKNHENPSKGKFFGACILFLLFWGFSFMTNVHYFIVTQHGYDNIVKQVESCKNYYVNRNINTAENIKREQKAIYDQVQAYWINFENSLQDSRKEMRGIGDDCISQLKAIENFLVSSNGNYNDMNTYKIWDPKYHQQFTKAMGYNDYGKVRELFNKRVNDAVDTKYAAIANFYSNTERSKKSQEIVNHADKILQNLSEMSKHEESVSFDSLYKCYKTDVTELLAQMPEDYRKDVMTDKIYPSERMFDFINVWSDKFKGKLPEYISFGGAVPMAIIFDLAGFILIALI